jgi:hypothetical protein
MYAGSSASTTGMPRIFPASARLANLAGKPEHPLKVDQVMQRGQCPLGMLRQPSQSRDSRRGAELPGRPKIVSAGVEPVINGE